MSTGTALADAAEIDDLGFLAVLENFDVVGTKIADRIAVFIGQAEVELHAAIGVEMFEAGISGSDFQARIRPRSPEPRKRNQITRKNVNTGGEAEVSIRGVHRWQTYSPDREGNQSSSLYQLDVHSSDCILAFAHRLGYPNR